MSAIARMVFVMALWGVSSPTMCPAQVRVQGYFRSDGTYVRPHYRSSPSSDSCNCCPSRACLPGGYGLRAYSPGGSSYLYSLNMRPRQPLDEAMREWADAIRERWKLEDEARERRDAQIAARRDAYFRYRSSREPRGDGSFTHEGVRYPSYAAFSQSPAYVELGRRAEQRTAEYEAAQVAARERYQQLVSADVRDARLRANGYSYELYPDRR